MNKLLFGITTAVSYKLNDLSFSIVSDGKHYEEHKTLFHIIDNLSTYIYNKGYNTFVIGQNNG